MGTFRDEETRWLTKMLGAQPHVELPGNGMGQRSSDDYPQWALEMEARGADSVGTLPLDWERAGATILRYVLHTLIESRYIGNGSTQFQELAKEAKSALLTIHAGT